MNDTVTTPVATSSPTQYYDFRSGKVVDAAVTSGMNTPASSTSFKDKASQFFSYIAKLFDFKFSFSFERFFSTLNIDWLVNTIQVQCDDFIENPRGVTPFDGNWSHDVTVQKEGNVEYVIGDKGQVYIKRDVLSQDMSENDFNSIKNILAEQQNRDKDYYAQKQASLLKKEIEKAPERKGYVIGQLEAKKEKYPVYREMYQAIIDHLNH